MEQQKMVVRKKNLRLSLVLFSIVVCFFFGIMLKVMLIGHGETVSQSTARPKYYVARYSLLAVLPCTVSSLRSVRLVFWPLVTVVQWFHSETRPASVILTDFASALA